MTEGLILKLLREVNGVITDSHFVYTSGKHGSVYVNKDAIYPHTLQTSDLCLAIARNYARSQVQAVIAPAIGAINLSQGVARHLTRLTGEEVLALYAEKDADGGFVIKRGYDKLLKGKFVLVVEDVITTGDSVKKVVEATIAAGGEVIGVAALCNRGGVTPEQIGACDLFSLVNVTLDAWNEEDCPLCTQDVPINTDVGKGREFLARKK